MEVQPKEIRNYLTADGINPFHEWLTSLRDRKAKAKIRARLDRVEDGNLGDCKSLGESIFELRIELWTLLPHILWARRNNNHYSFVWRR